MQAQQVRTTKSRANGNAPVQDDWFSTPALTAASTADNAENGQVVTTGIKLASDPPSGPPVVQSSRSLDNLIQASHTSSKNVSPSPPPNDDGDNPKGLSDIPVTNLEPVSLPDGRSGISLPGSQNMSVH